MSLGDVLSIIFVVCGAILFVRSKEIATQLTEKRRGSGIYSEKGLFSKKDEEVPETSVRQTAVAMIFIAILGFFLRHKGE